MLLRHDQQQTGSLDRSLHSLHSTFTHSQPKLTHHSLHRNKKFHCEINIPSSCTTTCEISKKMQKKCMQNGEEDIFMQKKLRPAPRL